MSGSRSEITEILGDLPRRDEEALRELIPLVFDELRRVARRCLAAEKPGHTLQPTALVHEVYLKLRQTRLRGFESRSQFFAFATRLMRQILVDYARARRTGKRGGEATLVSLPEIAETEDGPSLDLDSVLAVHEVLAKLEKIDARQSRIAELRYFGGLTLPEVAGVLGLSLATVERSWSVARLFLARELRGPAQPSGESSR
jgi:RNA polymerase sigma factor (TIGR02999 family)